MNAEEQLRSVLGTLEYEPFVHRIALKDRGSMFALLENKKLKCFIEAKHRFRHLGQLR